MASEERDGTVRDIDAAVDSGGDSRGDDSAPQTPPQPNRRIVYDRRQYTVIHDDNSVQSSLECQLESALEQQYSLIVVEPAGLGDNVIRWIRVGNFLHKSAVLASFGCLITAPFLPRTIVNMTSIPLGLFGVGCAAFYDISWRSDPCCKYQVDYRGTQLVHLPSHDLHSQTPVVLVKKNDKSRKILHNTLAVCVLGYCGWRLYQLYKSS